MRRWRVLLPALSLLAPAALGAQPDSLEIRFLDVGQGEAIVIRGPEGKTALVDAGPDDAVVEQLERLGVATIDFALATHGHADHIGGMRTVLAALDVRYFMDNGLPHTTETYLRLMRELGRSEDVVYLEARARTIELGTVRLRILPPPRDGDGQNNRSVGLLVQYGEFRALLTGDSEAEELNHFLSLGVPAVDLLKAAHHGSRDGLTPAWLAATDPQVVVISSGRGNPYGHPHREALRQYATVADRIYRTDRHGTITIRAARDGGFSVETEYGTDRRAVPASGSRPGRNGVRLRVQADAPGNDHENLNGEFVDLNNVGTSPVALGGWTLCDAANHCYTFPDGVILPAGGSARLFTGSGHDTGDRFFMNGRQAVWNNDGDVATLYDREGGVVIRHEY